MPIKTAARNKRTKALEYLFMVFLEKSTPEEQRTVRRIFTLWERESGLTIERAIPIGMVSDQKIEGVLKECREDGEPTTPYKAALFHLFVDAPWKEKGVAS